MTGTYNLTLVLASYCVASLAAYSAIYFGTRLFNIEGSSRKFWLWAGALCMGSGIWSMHFVGMSAYSMPHHLEMSFSLSYTLASWLPAVLASAIALFVIGQPQVAAGKVVLSALVMGAGISAMHYGGMAAMHMQPAISYDPLWFSVSIFIAVAASGAALVICRLVRTVPAKQALKVKIAAALVMGVAICGMHYTGMFAAIYAPDAIIPNSNLLRGSWMGIPTAAVTVLLLATAIYLAVQDYRYQESQKRKEQQRQAWVEDAAFIDTATGLMNQSRFDQLLLKRIAKEGNQGKFSLLLIQANNYNYAVQARGENAALADIVALANKFKSFCQQFDDSLLARYSKDSFILITPAYHADELLAIRAQLEETLEQNTLTRGKNWHIGMSLYPSFATSSRTLISIAKQKNMAA